MNRKLKYSYLLVFASFLLIAISTYSNNAKNNPLFQNHSFNAETVELVLSDEEKQWLQEHPVIKVGSDPNWAPFEFRNKEGKYQGLNIQYLKLIEEKLGIRFEYNQNNSWQEIVQLAYSKDIDILSGVNSTKERKQYLNFTDINIC